jgi:hypothetical protein
LGSINFRIFQPSVSCIKIQIKKKIILAVVLYGCKTWDTHSTRGRKENETEDGELRIVCRAKRENETRRLKNETIRKFIICTPQNKTTVRVLKSRGIKEAGLVGK